jgi:hypothetical protein
MRRVLPQVARQEFRKQRACLAVQTRTSPAAEPSPARSWPRYARMFLSSDDGDRSRSTALHSPVLRVLSIIAFHACLNHLELGCLLTVKQSASHASSRRKHKHRTLSDCVVCRFLTATTNCTLDRILRSQSSPSRLWVVCLIWVQLIRYVQLFTSLAIHIHHLKTTATILV